MLIPFQELFQRHGIRPRGVLHLGANTGQEASEYARLGIKTVIWVEALPDIYERLLLHLKSFPGQSALQACLSDRDGEEVSFNVASNDAQSSSFLEFGTHAKEHPTVKFIRKVPLVTSRIDTVLTQRGIELEGSEWMLNADLQGAELLAMRGLGRFWSHFRYAYIEVNEKELYVGCPLVQDINEYLGTHGFVGVQTKMTGNGWGDKVYIRVEDQDEE